MPLNGARNGTGTMRAITPIFMISVIVCALVPACCANAEMLEGDVWNVGSVFAAGTQCEMKGYITQGQTTPLMAQFLQRVPAIDSERFRDGYQQGLKRTAIYSKNYSRWVSFPLTAEGCSQVQYAITQYKLGMAAIKDNGAQHLTGGDRAQFIAGAANSCMSGYGKDELTSQVPRPLFEKYCQCYASGLADRASKNDLQGDDSPVMKSIIAAESKRCYAAMKEEAMRNYLNRN